MGAACSSAEQSEDKQQVGGMRSSFMSVRGIKKGAFLKQSRFFSAAYEIGDSVGEDEGVVSTTNKENEVEYVSRAVDKQHTLFRNPAELEDHLQTLSTLDHVHICRFVEAFDCEERLQLIYEKATPTSIFAVDEDLKTDNPIAQENAQVYCRQIAMALRVAHKQGIVHGRLSDSSLLVDNFEPTGSAKRSIKICDMGQTFILRPARSSSRIDFSAPEILLEELPMPANRRAYNDGVKAYQATDCWALGVLLYRMLTGKMPFLKKEGNDMRKTITETSVHFGTEWRDMREAKEVVHGLLRHSSRIRMTADQVARHPWIALSKASISRSKMMRVLNNVMWNTTESTFKKFTFRVIAEDMPAEKLAIVTQAFRYIDKDGDGNLDVEEIRKVLKRYGEEEASADEIFEAIDRDASGSLNFAEFTAVSLGPHEYCDSETLWHTFNRFDKDGNGNFDKAEIMTVMREVEYVADGAILENEVEEIAKDIKMPVDFDTFVQIIVTPTGQPISMASTSLDRFCYSVMKVDRHKVRHIPPKKFDSGKAGIFRSPYAQMPLKERG